MSNADVKQVSSTTGTFRALEARVATPAGNPAPETGKKAPDKAEARSVDVVELAARLNSAARSIGRDLRFKVNMSDGSSVIQVLDRDTGEIIREIPPEKARLSVSESGNIDLRLYDGSA